MDGCNAVKLWEQHKFHENIINEPPIYSHVKIYMWKIYFYVVPRTKKYSCKVTLQRVILRTINQVIIETTVLRNMSIPFVIKQISRNRNIYVFCIFY